MTLKIFCFFYVKKKSSSVNKKSRVNHKTRLRQNYQNNFLELLSSLNISTQGKISESTFWKHTKYRNCILNEKKKKIIFFFKMFV